MMNTKGRGYGEGHKKKKPPLSPGREGEAEFFRISIMQRPRQAVTETPFRLA